MRCMTFRRTLPAFALLLTLAACVTTPPPPEPVPQEDPAVVREREAHNAWLEQRNNAVQTLRGNPHLSVSELQQGEIVIRIRSGGLFRSSGKALNPNIKPVIEHIAAALVDNPLLQIQVIGHTDNVGSDKRNLQLSIERAEAVRDALVAAGVDAERVSHEGRGGAEPLASNDTREGRAVNRRVDLLIPAFIYDSAQDSAVAAPAPSPESAQDATPGQPE